MPRRSRGVVECSAGRSNPREPLSQHLPMRRRRVAIAPSSRSQLSSRPRPCDASEQPPLSESESEPPEEEPPPAPEPVPTHMFTAFCAQLVSDDELVQSPQLTLLPLTS